MSEITFDVVAQGGREYETRVSVIGEDLLHIEQVREPHNSLEEDSTEEVILDKPTVQAILDYLTVRGIV